jgi:hypothetical protein
LYDLHVQSITVLVSPKTARCESFIYVQEQAKE